VSQFLVAFFGALVGGVFALLGVLLAIRASDKRAAKDRRHDLELARDERLRALRAQLAVNIYPVQKYLEKASSTHISELALEPLLLIERQSRAGTFDDNMKATLVFHAADTAIDASK